MAKISKSATTLYKNIEKVWSETELVKPTGLQATEAVRLLWTIEFGKFPFRSIKLTTGNRMTWARGGVLTINPDGHFYGPWQDIVHDLSHLAHRMKNRGKRPHCIEQARIERRMQDNLMRRILS